MSFAVSLLNRPLSRDFVWELSALALFIYLLFHPALSHPLSLAVALGGGLFLLLWRPVGSGALAQLGPFWFLFLLYSFLSSVGSLSPGLSWQSDSFLFLGTCLTLMASASSQEAKSRFETAGFCLALFAGGLGLYQVFFGFDQWASQAPGMTGLDLRALHDAEKSRRAFGPLVTSGALAALLVLFIPVGFIQWKTKTGTKKFLFLLSSLFLLSALLATKSVGAWLSLGFAVSFILFYRKAWGWLLAAGISCLAAVVFILSSRGWNHWEIGALAARFSLWQGAWDLFKIHPWFGWGPGSFDLAYQQSGLPLNQGARFAHNLPLQLLVEQGLVGLGLFVAALVSFARRLKAPPLWEGWGVLTGAAAFFLFSLFDLPFQMPELIWVFALLLGRLELKPTKVSALYEIPRPCLEWGLLAVLLVSGFWPPFRGWNWALLAGALWLALGLTGRTLDKIPLWAATGGLFLIGRSLASPSALGAVRFLETAGLILVFVLVIGAFDKPDSFLKKFCALGLAWALGLWVYAFFSPDMKDWSIFPNPKQVATFLLPLLFLTLRNPWSGTFAQKWDIKQTIVSAFSLATFWILRPFGAALGLVAGATLEAPKRYRRWTILLTLLVLGSLLGLRALSLASGAAGATQWDRLSIWKSAVKVWATSPLIGVGPGAFAGDYDRLKDPRASGVSRYQMDAQFAHNEPLEWLTAFGILGAGLALALLWRFWPREGTANPDRRKGAALVALGTASFLDFCFHTPLIALQAAGLLAPAQKQKSSFSWPGGFLAWGLALGLFGAAAWAPSLLKQAVDLEQADQFPLALQKLDTAARLNAWDARIQGARADFLENLYLSTGDENWKSRSDDAFYSAQRLEQTDGQWPLKNARRLSARFEKRPTHDSFSQAWAAWICARVYLPEDAFVYFDEGVFEQQAGPAATPGGRAVWEARAGKDFQKAVELEPNYASAWVNLGYCQKRNPATRAQAQDSFKKALEVYEQWKDDDQMDPLEKEMVSLPPALVLSLQREVSSP